MWTSNPHPSLPTEIASIRADWLRHFTPSVEEFRRDLLSQTRSLREAAEYQSKCVGKRLRPTILLCFACLEQAVPQPKPSALRAAAALELLHEASLIHDDVLDRSPVRRDRSSIPERFGVSTASHLGAFMVSTAVSILAEVCEEQGTALDLELLRTMSRAQLEESYCPPGNRTGERQRCVTLIQGKTGSLFKLSAQMGASLAVAGEGREAGVRIAVPFSEHLALAFQLRDDLADLENDAHIRKPGGNDLVRGLPTLPFQIWAASLDDTDSAWKRLRLCRNNQDEATRLQEQILQSGVRREIRETILTELRATRTTLHSVPPCPARDTLDTILDGL